MTDVARDAIALVIAAYDADEEDSFTTIMSAYTDDETEDFIHDRVLQLIAALLRGVRFFAGLAEHYSAACFSLAGYPERAAERPVEEVLRAYLASDLPERTTPPWEES
jgi:hypothetical protein